MRVSILQRDIIWADPASNIRTADEAIDRQRGADLYVLPNVFDGLCDATRRTCRAE